MSRNIHREVEVGFIYLMIACVCDFTGTGSRRMVGSMRGDGMMEIIIIAISSISIIWHLSPYQYTGASNIEAESQIAIVPIPTIVFTMPFPNPNQPENQKESQQY